MSSLYIIIESFRRTLVEGMSASATHELSAEQSPGIWTMRGKLTGQSVYVAVCEEFKYILWGMGPVQRCGAGHTGPL